MTPKEQATKMIEDIKLIGILDYYSTAKRLALISVDEIKKAIDCNHFANRNHEYWNEVIEEIRRYE